MSGLPTRELDFPTTADSGCCGEAQTSRWEIRFKDLLGRDADQFFVKAFLGSSR